MPRGVRSNYWKKAKTRNKFMRLCKKARRDAVDWNKFREIDTEGEFKKFDNTKLSQMFRKIRLQRSGICWMCGNEPAVRKKSIGKNCQEKLRIYHKRAYHPC